MKLTMLVTPEMEGAPVRETPVRAASPNTTVGPEFVMVLAAMICNREEQTDQRRKSKLISDGRAKGRKTVRVCVPRSSWPNQG